MTDSLRDIRKDAGYKSAKELADKMGIPTPTFSRYEQSPDKIPIKAAWALADVLGCSIDEVVGRVDRHAPTPGSLQAAYDELPEASKMLVDEYMAFISGKESDAEKRAAAAEKALFAAQAQRYEEMFIRASAATEKASDVVLFGSDEDIREGYRSFVWSLLETKRDNEIEDFPRTWLESYCAVFDPHLDLHVDRDGHVRGEDEETRATASELLAQAIDKKTGKLIDRYKEVMEKVMEAYDSAHGLT